MHSAGATIPPPEEFPVPLVDFLLSDAGRAGLDSLAQVDLAAQGALALLSHLRTQFSPAQAGALLTQARLRRRAGEKFPQAQAMFFVTEALEQATAWTVAQHRAEWMHRHAPPGPILDLGCGIGGDTLALAQWREGVAYEWATDRLRFAQANLAALAAPRPVRFEQADWTAHLAAGSLLPAAAAFADPARRRDGRRLFSLKEMVPSLDVLLELADRIPALGVKVAPGVALAQVPPQAAVEFISHQGVCKEAVLWFGPLAQAGPARRWASVHRPGVGGQWHQVVADSEPPPLVPLPPGPQAQGLYLHEPDPAVIRAGGLGALCRALDAHLFDEQIAYLVGPGPVTHPLVQSFRLLEIHDFSLKLLNRRLAALGMGRLEIKKRGSPIDPEAFRASLRPAPTDRPGVIFLTRQGERRLMLIGERPG